MSRRLWLGIGLVIVACFFLGTFLPLAVQPVQATPPFQPKHPVADVVLYRHITERIERGQTYYAAAVAEQRFHGYPLRPVPTIRQPTLAYIDAALPLPIVALILLAFCAAAWGLLPGLMLWERVLIVLAMIVGGRHAFVGNFTIHDYWAGLLVAISIAIHREHRWWPSVLVGLAACAIRELALPYLLLCAADALAGRRWRELAGWTTAVAAFFAWYALHAWNLAQVVTPADRYMADWATVIAYPNKAAWLGQLTVFHWLPRPAGAALAVLGLAGWLALDQRSGRIVFLYLAGTMLMITLAAMPSNTHWAFLLFPLWIAGFGLWPSLIVKGLRALRDGPVLQGRPVS